MKNSITLFILLSFFFGGLNVAYGQSSKSCGSCQKPVSAYSEVGDYCPHCGVRWGYENTSTRYVETPTYTTYQSASGVATVSANANLRSSASKSAYVLTVVPKYSVVTLLGKYGHWYHVSYQSGTSYYSTSGYIHDSLIDR
jgi:uncharacterized protein YgiM (DUF1202 family)